MKLAVVTTVLAGIVVVAMVLFIRLPVPVPSNILVPGLGSDFYFAVDRATVSETFHECSERLRSLSEQIGSRQHAALILSWVGYLLGLLATLSVYAMHSLRADKATLLQLSFVKRLERIVWVLPLVATLIMGVVGRLATDTQDIAGKMYRLRDFAAMARLQLEATGDPAIAQNLIDALRVEVRESR